ncbi:MAG: hypothetical protein U0271_00145 [Polyangiaceae bacterium]
MREASRRARTGLALLALASLVAATVGACTNDARDSHCTPDEPDRASNPDCLYGTSGKGPIVTEAECPAVEGDVPTVCPSFYDVLDVFADPARGNCTSFGCHGAPDNAALGIYLPVADPQAFYEELLDTTGSIGRPFVVADDAATPANEALDSWMMCTLTGAPGGAVPMPKPGGLQAQADIDLVRDWLLCGAQAPEECVAGGADGACVTCAKDKCCGKVVQCAADATCAACAVCVQTNGGFDMCTAVCDTNNPQIAGLTSCVRGLCMTDCPGVN